MPSVFSTREMAELLGTETWRVRRLFEDGTIPEPQRFAGKRAIPRERIPEVLDALRRRGWVPQAQEAAQ
jgi:predicted site-specific integrase-resolvase